MLIEREGLFKGIVTDSGVGESSGGLPQFMVAVSAKEKQEGEDWIDWSEYDQEATGYLVLVNHDKSDSFKIEWIMEATGWSGLSFADLDSIDLVGKEIKFEMVENDYDGKITYQVNWIGSLDAEPRRSIKKLDSKALKSLDQKFGRKAKPKAAKPAAKSKASPPKKSPPKPPAKKGKPTAEGSMTKDEAWDSLNQQEMWAERADDREMSEAVLIDLWSKAIEEMGDDEDKFSGGYWFIIHEKIAKMIFMF